MIQNKTTMKDDSYFIYKVNYKPKGWFKCTRQHVLNHILENKKMNLRDNPFVCYQIFTLTGELITTVNTVIEIADYLQVKLNGVETNIRIQRKHKFKKFIPFHHKYIIYVNSIEDLVSKINIQWNYYKLYKENILILITDSIQELSDLIQVNYQTLYDKLRRENIILINNYRIEYHKLDDVANHS